MGGLGSAEGDVGVAVEPGWFWVKEGERRRKRLKKVVVRRLTRMFVVGIVKGCRHWRRGF